MHRSFIISFPFQTRLEVELHVWKCNSVHLKKWLLNTYFISRTVLEKHKCISKDGRWAIMRYQRSKWEFKVYSWYYWLRHRRRNQQLYSSFCIPGRTLRIWRWLLQQFCLVGISHYFYSWENHNSETLLIWGHTTNKYQGSIPNPGLLDSRIPCSFHNGMLPLTVSFCSYLLSSAS